MRPHRRTRQIRAYFQGLGLIAPKTGPCTDLDVVGLPVIATEAVADRVVRFSWVVGQPRLRLTLPHLEPETLGSIDGLDTRDPRLHLSEPIHAEWGSEHTEALLKAAQTAWETRQRQCSG